MLNDAGVCYYNLIGSSLNRMKTVKKPSFHMRPSPRIKVNYMVDQVLLVHL